MNNAIHPQAAEVLQHLQRFTSTLDEQLHRSKAQTFTGADEAKTVAVTIDGRHVLTGLYIEEGLLRLGAEAVEMRINEALQVAQTAASAAVEMQHEQLLASLVGVTDSLKECLGRP